MEASALHAPAGFARGKVALGSPLLRLRSDEQLVALFRAGHEEAFRVIHDRYHARLFAYARQMLSSRQDAEDVLQEVFVRAYAGLRRNHRDLALRAWLYRVAHNRCVDQLRRPVLPPAEALGRCLAPVPDPAARAEERESLRRLIADLHRLPDHQRSALLMRELGGMSYDELSVALAVSVPAVKSVLVRARVSLARAVEARDTACDAIREELILAHDGRRRPLALARRHLRDCPGCREFRGEIRGVSRQLAALAPTLGPLGVLANALGIGGGGAAAGGSAAASSSVLSGGGVLAGGLGHVATVLAAAAVTAGGAVEIQNQFALRGVPHPAHQIVGGSGVTPAATIRALAASVGTDTGSVAAAANPAPPPPAVTGSRAVPAAAARPAASRNAAASTPGASPDTGAQPIPAAALDAGMGPGPGGGSDPTAPASAGLDAVANGTTAGAGTSTSSAGNGAAIASSQSAGGTPGGAPNQTAGGTSPIVVSLGTPGASGPTATPASGAGTGPGTSTASTAKSSVTSKS